MFKADFYIAEVGMIPGAAYLFCHWVEEELSRLGQRRQVVEMQWSFQGQGYKGYEESNSLMQK
jgi:hypothetical protein